MAKKNIQIAHIYHGAMGNNGLYIHEIVNVLNKIGIKQEVYVSYYYPKDYGRKFFFRYTDLLSGIKSKWWRPYLRMGELIVGLARTLISVRSNKPKIINYSLIQAFTPELFFLKILKKITKSKLIITCHDVKPFANKYTTLKQSVNLRKKIFNLADYLLIHNSSSKEDLMNYFGISTDKIISHPFPLMDISQLYENIDIDPSLKVDFLFIGHMREEKGIDLLLHAWEKYHKIKPDATLIIAGNNPNHYNFKDYQNMGIKVFEGFLDDSLYCKLIKSARYVVLPYRHGTNSGVASTVIGMGKQLICSDIPMFKKNPLIPPSSLFKSMSIDNLCQKMLECLDNDINSEAERRNQAYKERFSTSVISTYTNILKQIP